MRPAVVRSAVVRPAALAALWLLAACAAPEAPRGVGFGDYADYAGERAARDAALSGMPVPDGTILRGPVYAGATTAAPARTDNPGISDEQSFDAVSGRETIQSDADRRAAQRAVYRPVAPGDLPTRPRDNGPDIVAYALSTTNRVGEPLYDRGRSDGGRIGRGCGRYVSSDLAQEAFLAAGGPARDRRALDPDGDGFACAWDPAPFRTIRR